MMLFDLNKHSILNSFAIYVHIIISAHSDSVYHQTTKLNKILYRLGNTLGSCHSERRNILFSPSVIIVIATTATKLEVFYCSSSINSYTLRVCMYIQHLMFTGDQLDNYFKKQRPKVFFRFPSILQTFAFFQLNHL